VAADQVLAMEVLLVVVETAADLVQREQVVLEVDPAVMLVII
jgi:hypothetical protein